MSFYFLSQSMAEDGGMINILLYIPK